MAVQYSTEFSTIDITKFSTIQFLKFSLRAMSTQNKAGLNMSLPTDKRPLICIPTIDIDLNQLHTRLMENNDFMQQSNTVKCS